jgi:LCP family protein required for cell wall assembly
MVNDLYSKKIDAIFVPSNYITLFNGEDAFVNIENDTKVVYSLSETLENSDAGIVSDKDFSEPLSILIMGVDSEANGLNANAAFNGDTLMLITFNPKTLTATMFSIPRDTYVPIACRNGAKNKINSAAAYGTQCVLNTVSDFTGVDIDYYVKINFKGVVELVDALGGVEVNVEAPDIKTYGNKVCEQNSDRQFGSKIVCMEPGEQTLNGEQALAYSRCRHLYLLSDLARINHQQDVVQAISKKVVKMSSINEFQNVLNAISNNIATNMSTNQILSGYKVIKSMYKNALNGEEFLNITKTSLEVYNLSVYLSSSGMYSSALGYYPDSLKAIQKEMNVNLGKADPELIKTFSFSVNKEFEILPVGKGITGGETDGTLISFVNSTVGYTQAYCSKHNLKCNFEYVDETNEHYNNTYEDGMIGDQSVHQGTLLSNISSITFYVNKKSETKVNTTTTTDTTKSNETDKTKTTDSDTKKSDNSTTIEPIPGNP